MSANSEINWADQLKASVTVCDRKGIVVYMNQQSIQQFQKYGGSQLIGKSLIDCHPEPSKTKLISMLDTPTENIYTTEQKGTRKMIIQKPWVQEGEFMGVVEISFELPEYMPHFIRD